MSRVKVTLEFDNFVEASKALSLLGEDPPVASLTSNLGAELEEDVSNREEVVQFPEPAAVIESTPLDANGLPWDERIHSSSKKQTQKGVWTKRKNVDPAVFDQVMAELQGVPRPTPVQAVIPMTAPVQTAPATFPPPGTPPVPAVQPVVEQPAPVVTNVPKTPPELMPMFTSHGYTSQMINDFVKQHFDYPSIAVVFAKYKQEPDIVERIATQFLKVVGGQQ